MSVGSQLQEARRERKLSLPDVTRETKIQPWVLEALESDRLQELMSPIYVKGFLATYARFLRLDPEPLVAQLPRAHPAPAQQQEELPPAKPAPPIVIQFPWPLVRRMAKGLAVTAAVAAMIVINPLKWVSRIHLSLPAVSLPKLAKSERSGKPASARKAAARASVSAQSAKPTRVAASTSGEAGWTQASAPAAKPRLASAAPAAGEAALKPPALQLANVAPVAEPFKPPVLPAPTVAAVQPLELVVTANRTTTIRLWADGKLLAQQRLARGSNERWRAKKQFKLVLSNPVQADVVLNGQSISPFVIAQRGRVLITHQGVAPLREE